MSINTIHDLVLTMQDTREGIFTVQGIAFTRLLHNIIREYGTYYDGTINVNIDSLDSSDKKLILSHLLDASEYEYACENIVNLEVVFNEYRNTINSLIDEECYTVYKENMEEQEMVMGRHSDNGEIYWRRR